MSVLGSSALTVLIPWIISGCSIFWYWAEEKPKTAFYSISLKIFLICSGIEIFFILLAIWGVS